MKSFTKCVLPLGLLAFMISPACAQSQSTPCVPVSRSFGFLQVTAATGCPFSATVEILRTQTLADGTHVRTKAKSLVYRDSHGRVAYYTYQPVGLNEPDPNSPNFITISDPVAGFGYILLPQRSHVATRASLTPRGALPPPPAPPTRSESETKVSFERLGTQDILGFVVTGERRTRTLPVGMDHNDRPITVVSETWRSTELGLVFLRTDSDPRNVDEEIRVSSFEQSEPDSALFQLPASYTVQDQKPQ